MRRGVLLGMVFALVACAPAGAQTLVTLTTSSAFVDPAKQAFNKPPCDAPARPNALRVNVLLPDGYAASKRKRWPVLYLLHGHGDSYDAWAAACNGNVQEVAKGFPGIIVMPEGAQGWYADWWHDGKRNDPAWERYYLDELLPLIEKRFRIRAARQWHAIAGLSMGGEGAMYLAEQRPGYFGSVASFSGPLSIQRPEYANAGMDSQGQKFTDVFGPAGDFYATAHNPSANTQNLAYTRAYVTVGDGTGGDPANWFGRIAEVDLARHAEDFVNAAKQNGVDVTFVPRDGIHDWPFWREHLAAALSWGFFAPVPAAPANWTLRSAGQSGRAWGFRWSFEAPPTALVTFTRNGSRIAATGSGVVTMRTPAGATFRTSLPFDRQIPAKPKRHRRH